MLNLYAIELLAEQRQMQFQEEARRRRLIRLFTRGRPGRARLLLAGLGGLLVAAGSRLRAVAAIDAGAQGAPPEPVGRVQCLS